MEIIVQEEKKIVEVWLTKEEKTDAKLRESLKPLYKKYHVQKYMVAVFLSGNGDLEQGTRDLLIHNKKVLARKMADKSCGFSGGRQ